MRIDSLRLHDFRGYRDAKFEFGDFSCLFGENACGKTTILDAISLLCGSLDFSGELSGNTENLAVDEWKPKVTGQQRLQAYLKKNVRFHWEKDGARSFAIEGSFSHEGKKCSALLTEKGFEKNDLRSQPWWWPGIVYFAKFDSDLVNFQLRHELWPRFAEAYEAITGMRVDPELMTLDDLEDFGQGGVMATGFFLHKDGGRVHSRSASAGEKKIAKTLSQVVNLEPSRLPHIVLVDNMEMHVHYKRHLAMVEEVKRLFHGMQLVTTTHSMAIIEGYRPAEHLIDVPMTKEGTQ